MREKNEQSAIWAIRVGLALTYLYSGFHLLTNPAPWAGFVPDWFSVLLPVPLEIYLQFQGAVELFFVASLLSGFLIRWVALLSAIEMAGILAFSGINLVTFRDMAILASSLALYLYFSPSLYGEHKGQKKD